MTVTWHANDLKVSHKDPNKVTTFIFKTYGPNITVSRGETHDYLGMDLDFSTKGVVKIFMIKYVKKIIVIFSQRNQRNQ